MENEKAARPAATPYHLAVEQNLFRFHRLGSVRSPIRRQAVGRGRRTRRDI